MPTTASSGVRFLARNSAPAASMLSSAPSTASCTAAGPPAINATTNSGEVLNVGGHSEASRIASRPEVPAPT